MSAPTGSRGDYEVRLLALLAVCVSVVSFLYCYRHDEVLLYGDAVAHINIARRVFDSKTPGLLQLGTVWLPLPHLLILPFVVSQRLWQQGAGGSIPSMAAYVFGVVGIFRLARGMVGAAPRLGLKSTAARADPMTASRSAGTRPAGIAAWTAALIYGANPNLIYMQTTAMGEVLYLAFFLWAVVYFSEYVREQDPGEQARSLTRCGLCLAAACLTRYDGWFLAGVVVVAAVAVTVRSHLAQKAHSGGAPLRTAVVKFVLLAAAGPVLWLAYNAAIYRHPLEFATGPYSARAIEKKTGTINPAKDNVYAGSSYFLKAAELNVGEAAWQGRLWLVGAVLGSLLAWFGDRGRAVLLLWLPLPFYALSMAYGSVPIFVPPWWPYSHYNLRYGLQLLPAFAVFIGLAVAFLVDLGKKFSGPSAGRGRGWGSAAAVLVFFLLVGGSYLEIWRAGPICYQEAAVNMHSRVVLEKELAVLLEKLPPDSTLLMYLGDHVGALERGGIRLRRVINEGNHRVWKQPEDPEGLWERALADPASHADYVVGFEGDRVWEAALGKHLPELVELHTAGQPRAILYQGRLR